MDNENNDSATKAKKTYQQPLVERLDNLKPESGSYFAISENTSGVLSPS